VATIITQAEERLDMIETDIRKHAINLMHKLISTESAMLTKFLKRSAFTEVGPVEAAGSLRGSSR
jgi:hypothetical protein